MALRFRFKDVLLPLRIKYAGDTVVQAGTWVGWQDGVGLVPSTSEVPHEYVCMAPAVPHEYVDVCISAVVHLDGVHLDVGEPLRYVDGEYYFGGDGTIVGRVIDTEYAVLMVPRVVVNVGGTYGNTTGDTPEHRAVPVQEPETDGSVRVGDNGGDNNVHPRRTTRNVSRRNNPV